MKPPAILCNTEQGTFDVFVVAIEMLYICLIGMTVQ